MALIQGAYGIQITTSGGSNGESGSVSMNFDTLKTTDVNSQMTISGATVTPSTAIVGPMPKFEQTHAVKDASGKSASVYVKVMNAPSGLTYTSKVLPKECSVGTQTQVSAEQWLTVLKADSILCTATASYGSLSAGVGLKETKSTATGDYVTLTGYNGKATATATSVSTSQTATSGAADSITINGSAKDSSGSYSINTPLKGITGGKATFEGLSEKSSSGTTTQVVQKEHLHGTFTSIAYTPMTGFPQTNTRTSNYGNDYDLNMKAAKGSSPTGIVGYYVNSMTNANKIQGAVNAAAQFGDTINVAAGTYKENVKIDKSLTLKGAGSTKTIVDGNKAGSVFNIGTVNPIVNVAMSGMNIQNGVASSGGGIYNRAQYGLTVSDSIISGNSARYGGGIFNAYGTATISNSKISGNSASGSFSYGGGIFNLGIVAVTSSTLSGNSAKYVGGGICNYGTVAVSGSTISGNSASYGGGIDMERTDAKLTASGSTISGNSAYYGGGFYIVDGTAKISNSKISTNSAISGGGIGNYNYGTATISGSTISGNSASGSFSSGGGIDNGGTLTVTGSIISGNSAKYNGGGICNGGTLKVLGSTLSKNLASYGGGICNYYGSVTVMDSTISGNSAKYDGGGIYNANIINLNGITQVINNRATKGYGGGIYSDAGSVTVDGTRVAVKSNKANLPSSQSSWYQGWGIYCDTPTTKNGFNPATQVTGNTHI